MIVLILIALAALGLGGTALEHFFGNYGSSGVAIPTTTLATAPAAPAPATGPVLRSSLSALTGLKSLNGVPAPRFSLQDQAGSLQTVPRPPSEAIVLAFENSACNDICPVLDQMLSQSARDLGPSARAVRYLVVNTDPRATNVTATVPALDSTLRSSIPSAVFLTGPLNKLDAIWRSYGVTVTVSSTGVATHNDLLYVIDARGRLRSQLTPFANESPSGVYQLAPKNITAFASGIAQSVRQAQEAR